MHPVADAPKPSRRAYSVISAPRSVIPLPDSHLRSIMAIGGQWYRYPSRPKSLCLGLFYKGLATTVAKYALLTV